MMKLDGAQLALLETPCMVIDVEQAQKNILKMQKIADKYGCRLRPHIKTHKMPLFAHKQISAGAGGITCAKVSEAEVMAEGGIGDIFIAYPLVGDFRIQRAIKLSGKVSRLILAVDSLEGAKTLNRAAQEANVVLEVRLEIDTGLKRTGVAGDNAAALAVAVSRMKHLKLTGIYTFKGLIYHNEPTMESRMAGVEEGLLMHEFFTQITKAGVPLEDVSAGSSPTGEEVAKTGLVNEIRPGTYIFNDYMLYKENAAELNEIAVRFYATVVSTPAPDYAVIDGGTKTFPTDVQLNAPPAFYPGYAIVEGREDLRLSRMNEEHGIITGMSGKTGLSVGEKIALIPIHVCTAINMQNSVYLLENGSLAGQKVEARGMLV